VRSFVWISPAEAIQKWSCDRLPHKTLKSWEFGAMSCITIRLYVYSRGKILLKFYCNKMENWKLASPKLQLKTEFVRIKQLQLRFLCLLCVAEHLLGREVEASLATATLKEMYLWSWEVNIFQGADAKGHSTRHRENRALISYDLDKRPRQNIKGNGKLTCIIKLSSIKICLLELLEMIEKN